MDDKKKSSPSQASKETHKAPENPIKAGMPRTNSRRVFSKRWMYPAVYLGAAALIIGLMYARSQMGGGTTSTQGAGAQPTGATVAENYSWPVQSGVTPKVSLGFTDSKATAKVQSASLVFYDNAFYPHNGVDIASSNGKQFEVSASVSGKVTDVVDSGNDAALYGKTVKVQSPDGYVEVYQSLDSTSVKKGDQIQQGQTIGMSGMCKFEPKAGNHVYFEVDKDNAPVNPMSLLPKQN